LIVGLKGVVLFKDLTKLHLDVNGVIYELLVSFFTSDTVTKNDNLHIHTTFIVKEDSQSLYGFLDLNEKKIFDILIKINGIGGKVAMAICSTFTPSEFASIISNSDVKTLTKVSGIGPKGAKKILLELSDIELDSHEEVSNKNEASLALESLGFKKEIILKALKDLDGNLDTASLVKEALKRI